MVGEAPSGSAVCRQLLLLAALLFGIVTMHTVGHPAAEHAPSASVPVSVSGAVALPVSASVAMPVSGAMYVSDAAHSSPDHSPMSGMDPLSVCLAVLGAWGLALIGAWLLLGLRADGRPLGAPVGAGLLRVLRPNPPPPISVLAGVSVLRI
ncbi:hypothetical protein [Streptomyces cyaneofuscatus]|uniref:Uncharacterized protein n=1 Tax=Streptomyces cyaneofuscatus TaxID=66883 RepID=A0ABZ1F765_9ACTN|nr:hypothetical protein [Streptomyces cyaneofuscatus]WSB12278.1 hypothetical protein OG849_08680 [Streptomyces cyaneofuscatus]WSD51031.1 hypothetical protein OG857_26715 [Streptomyces cyaneofuscatus]WTA94538.1 hypothetical protein OG323_27930 [Streptomyces cyaneofuscatus]